MQSEYAKSYHNLYHNHWWWRSREHILVRALRGLQLPADAQILDVGCGDGLFFSQLRQFGEVRGIETDTSLLDPSNPDRPLISTQPLGHSSHVDERYDLITACDVIEHIEDDSAAVQHMVSMLKPGGFLLITVPAFMSLWDEHDELNHHYRRYEASGLRRVLPRSLSLLELRYLFHTIFIPKYLVSVVNKTRKAKVDQSSMPSTFVNRAMATFCEWENRLWASRYMPFGTSLLAIAQRPS